MQTYLKIVGNGQRTMRDLTSEEAEAAMEMVMDGRASAVQVAALMAALRIKEESTDELVAFTRLLRRYSTRLELDHPHLVDICVPYDGRSKSPVLIPAAAFIAASCGVKVALHGRPGQITSPKFGVGVGDVLAALDVPINLSLDGAASVLMDDAIGVGVVASEQFAPRLEVFNPIRIDYGMRSFFNTIEKLVNPFGAAAAIVGVFHAPVLPRVANTMQRQGYGRGIAVQGSEGSIEVLTSRKTPILTFDDPTGDPAELTLDPAAFGWWERGADMSNLTSRANADLNVQLLDPANGDVPSMYRRSALMTAALMVLAGRNADTFEKALTMVQEALASGEPLARLERLRTAAHALQASALNE
jgi:anthranilate phosphoribosyltransferase